MAIVKMTTGNKYKGCNTKVLCRRSHMRLKKFRKDHPEVIITRVVQDIYKTYGTLCVSYTDNNGQKWSNPYIFFNA